MEKSNTGNLPKGVRTLSIRKILLIFHQVTITLTLQAVYTHRGQYIVKKYIPSSPPNIIDGENDQLSVRLDTYISAGRGWYKKARNDTWKRLSSWADYDARRSRKNDQECL